MAGLGKLQKMIESSLVRGLLYAPAKIYELAVRARIAAYRNKLFKSFRLNAPVISIGNLTVGGTGKTPCVAFVALVLRDAGHQVAILSRGYKRQTSGRVEVSNDKQILCSPAESGDEPFLLAQTCRGVRVVVDHDRFAAGQWLEARAPISVFGLPVSVFVLDDAYQHLRLARDLNLLLVDATEPLGQAAMIPFGRLREPLSEMRRADAIIITRSSRLKGFAGRAEILEAIKKLSRPGIPVFFADHRLTGLRNLQSGEVFGLSEFSGRNVAAVSGIAKPDRFNEDLKNAGLQIVLRKDFTDHHRYSTAEFAGILRESEAAQAEAVVVTEKDAMNLPDEAIRQITLPVFAAQIEFSCEEETSLRELLLAAASKR